MITRTTSRWRAVVGVGIVATTLACGSVSARRDGGGGGASDAQLANGGAEGGAAGSGGAPDGGGAALGVLVRGSIGPLGPAPAASGTVRLVRPRLSVPGPALCGVSVCLINGGVVP